VTLPDAVIKEGEQINEQVEGVFSRTAEWINRTRKE
jgi:hypothetical protein